MTNFDVIVIGGGPGGYVAAIKAAQLGLKVACIEKRETLGGTCLNVGCIPSKALLHSSFMYYEAAHSFAEHGIGTKGLSLDLGKMQLRKERVVADLCKGIEGLFKKNKVERFTGLGSIKSPTQVLVTDSTGKETNLSTKSIIIATGSDPISLPGITIDEQYIVSSTGALAIESVPKSMMVIGAGYIGLEMGSVWSRLGADVQVVEYAPAILAAMDTDIASEAQKILTKQGLKFQLATKVLSANVKGKKVQVELESMENGSKQKLEVDVVLVSAGRKPHTEKLGLENVGIKLDERGRIPTDQQCRTSVSNIYAIGDVVAGPMLAHKAEEEGVAVAEILAGQKPQINHHNIPGVVYTHPEIASIGKTERELKAEGTEYKASKFPFLANSRAKTTGETSGFVKILTCAKTDRILGAHIIGPAAGELIQSLVLGIEYQASAEDIARTCHAHPGFSEAVKEAALGAFFKPIHI